MNHFVKGWIKNLNNVKVSNFAFVSSTNKISKLAKINRFVKIKHSEIGDYSYVGSNCDITNTMIGRFCSIADNCRIGTASHTLGNISTSPIFTLKKNGTGTTWINQDVHHTNETKVVNIGNDIWIGTRVIIKDGITIGDGAVIGAGAVVVKDVPPYAIVGGVPNKIIRYRFEPEVIEKLLELQWWNLSDEILKSNISFFQKENFSVKDIEDFIENTKNT